ncbi:Uncharacterized protein DAT39_022083, partial [Clarias magur]
RVSFLTCRLECTRDEAGLVLTQAQAGDSEAQDSRAHAQRQRTLRGDPEEEAEVPPRHEGADGDQKVPEIYKPAAAESTVFTPGSGGVSGVLQGEYKVAGLCSLSPTG